MKKTKITFVPSLFHPLPIFYSPYFSTIPTKQTLKVDGESSCGGQSVQIGILFTSHLLQACHGSRLKHYNTMKPHKSDQISHGHNRQPNVTLRGVQPTHKPTKTDSTQPNPLSWVSF